MSFRDTLRIRTRLRSAAHRIWPPKPKPLILVYHRIADDSVDYWRLAVSLLHFEEHLAVLRRTRHPLPLSEFVNRLETGTLPSNAVAVTFDDGYVDNLLSGKPRLVAADIPATVFLATSYLDSTESFWWDELANLILPEDGPRTFELLIRGVPKRFAMSAGAVSDDATTSTAPSEKRQATLKALWQSLRLLGEEERKAIMAQLRSIFACRDHRAHVGRAMSRQEVAALTSDDLITIGAHTATHPVLTALGTTACHREITESKLACEALIGAPIMAFAYPYGEFDTMVRDAVKTAGFTFACSTRYGPVTGTSDRFALPRITVPNINGEKFEETLHSASAS